MGFLSHDIYDSQDSRGRGMQFLISLYRFHPLHEHWHISQAITAESSPLHMASGWTRKRNLWPRPFECDAESQITYENAKQEIIWADNFDSSFNTIVAGKEQPFSIYTECLIVIQALFLRKQFERGFETTLHIFYCTAQTKRCKIQFTRQSL